MKNILFVGPYYQNDGWGNAAAEYVRALRETGHNITVKPVYMTETNINEDSAEFLDLEENRFDNYDVIIQNCLPSMLRYYGGVKNVCLAYFETTIKATPWVEQLNLMDEVWVTSHFEKGQLSDSGVTTDVKVIPIPCDTSKYNNNDKCKLLDAHKDEFKFYFIGEFIERKNAEQLILAFHREFSPSEQVRIVLKTNLTGFKSDVVMDKVMNVVNKIRKYSGIYPVENMYKSEVVLPSFLTDEEMTALHNECDCFVMPSSGEAFCIPAFNAMASGSHVIYNENSGVLDYMSGVHGGLPVKSHEAPCSAKDKPMKFLYTSRDTWYQIDTIDMQRQMRHAFVNRSKKMKEKRKELIAKEVLPYYTYKKIAETIKEVL